MNTLRTLEPCGGSEVKNNINTVQFLAQTDGFVSLDLNVSPQAAGFHSVLSVCVFSLKAVGTIDWHQLSATAILVCVLLKKQSHLGCPWGKQINITFSFLGELSL